MPDNQNIMLSKFVLEQLLTAAVQIGNYQFAVDNGMIKEYISQGVAYKKYGRHTVDRWTKEGKVTPVKQVRAVKFKSAELEKLSKINELHRKFIE